MRLHLPVSLRKSLLSCVVAAVASTYSCGAVWASSVTAPQNLIFDGETLTWNTDADNKAFTNAQGEASSFTSGDNVTFASEATVALSEDIKAGQINIASGADVVIELDDNGLNFDTLSMFGGSLDTGASLNISAGETLAVGSNNSVLKSALVLESDSCLSVDYSGSGGATSLNNSSLFLQGDTHLQLSGCGNGDGKTYTLLTGVSELRDSQGNAISLEEGDNAISSYFDINQPGSGFWKDAMMVLSDGSLQLVRHNEAVKEAVTITTSQESGADYQYYAGVCIKNIEPSSSSYAAISGGTIILSNNGSVEFSGNTATSSHSSVQGGAICGYDNDIVLSGNGSVIFNKNSASSNNGDASGGAIYGGSSSTITLSNNESVTINGNTASGSSYVRGGAIYGDFYSTITLSNNGSVTFNGNTASSSYYYASGGAIYGGSSITLSNNGSVEFRNNTVSGCGGAIYGWNITLDNNGTVEFCDNAASASGSGGAIYGRVMMTKNASVAFNRNKSSAIVGSATMINNGTISFQGNASGSGAAIAVFSEGELRLQDNEVIIFEDNTARLGGAIMIYHYGGVKIENNGEVLFSKNSIISETSAYSSGGAIYVMYDSSLAIENNDAVVFEKNVEVCADSYRLRSVYVYSGFSEGNVVSFSAAENKKVEFRDSLYIGSNTELNFNADYTDAESKTHSQQGDIVFTGKYTELHLAEVKGSAGTAEEILTSRTTEVNTMTNLYGGRLRVEDGAIYQGYGITAHEGSCATVLVKDAVLSHADYELHFYEGTKLEALGTSEIFGDVIVESTATAAFSALTRLEGSLTLASGSTLLLEGALTLDGALTLGTSLTLGGNMLEMVNLLQAGQALTLISGLDSLAVQTGESEYTTIASVQELLAADYFSNLDSGKGLVFVYNGEAGSLSMMRVIPEPATTTLSLLALTALVSRRRRK